MGRIFIAVIALVLCVSPSVADVEVLWLGHATTRLTSSDGKVIVVDPFLKKNPKTPPKYRDLTALGHVDLILVTHGHTDHVQDLKELAELTDATVVAPYEFALNLISLGVLQSQKVIGMNKGGTVSPVGRGIKIHMVPAEHGSSIDLRIPGLTLETNSPRMIQGGPAVGYVVEFGNGFSIYHSGDTAVFSDMALVHEFYKPDLALIVIGGHFSMGPEGAAYALKHFVKPKQAIPIHFGTFPVINRTPLELKQAMGESSIEILDVEPGQALNY